MEDLRLQAPRKLTFFKLAFETYVSRYISSLSFTFKGTVSDKDNWFFIEWSVKKITLQIPKYATVSAPKVAYVSLPRRGQGHFRASLAKATRGKEEEDSRSFCLVTSAYSYSVFNADENEVSFNH